MEKLDELKELAMPLYNWLLENYGPMCQVIISYGEVKITRDEEKSVLPIEEDKK